LQKFCIFGLQGISCHEHKTLRLPEEADTEREALRSAWLASLRKDAWIEIKL
jgi:hypothetical protein